MNLLAHALLACTTLPDPSGQTCTGALMADYYPGSTIEVYPSGIRTGILQHRAIDAFTDGHPRFIACRKAIAEAGAPRFTAGILADIFWDHVLASEWPDWGLPLCGLELEPFCLRVYHMLDLTRDFQNPGFTDALEWMSRHHWLARYASLDGIGNTLRGLSGRMSGKPDLAAAVKILVALDKPIRAAFLEFWPELVAFSRDWARRKTPATAQERGIQG